MSPQGLIVALDVESGDAARRLVERVGPAVDFYKVAPSMTLKDPTFLPWLAAQGKKIFLDCKWYDIPSQVERSVAAAGSLGLTAVTIHTSAAAAVMRRAVAPSPRPWVWGVTVLTSFGPEDLAEVGLSVAPAVQVERLALLAQRAGLDGLVCSPHEVAALRCAGIKLTLVTPGISWGDNQGSDQKRVATPRAAWAAGADYIVVGRAVLEAADPARAAAEILKERTRP